MKNLVLVLWGLSIVRISAVYFLRLEMIGDDTLGYLSPDMSTFSLALSSNFAAGWLVKAFHFNDSGSFIAIWASLLPAIPFYLIARRIVPENFAIFGAVIFVLTPAFGFVLGYGFATLIGLSIGLFGFNLMLRGIEDETRTMNAQLYIAAGISMVALMIPFSLSAALPFVLITGMFGVALFLDSRFMESSPLLIAGFLGSAVALVFLANFYEVGWVEFRPFLFVLTVSAVLVGVYYYSARFIEGAMQTFIISAMVATWGLSIVSSTGFDLNLVLGRAWLWTALPVILVITHMAANIAKRFSVPPRLSFALGVGGVMLFAMGWHQSFAESATQHSTLTFASDAAIGALEERYAEAPGVVAVSPHSLSWHVKQRDPLIVVLAEPIDPLTNTFDPHKVLDVRYDLKKQGHVVTLTDRHTKTEIIFDRKGVQHER